MPSRSRTPPASFARRICGRSSTPQGGNCSPPCGTPKPQAFAIAAISIADFVPSRKELNICGFIRSMDAMGNYPLQPKYEPVWDALEETGMVYGMHPFPAFGSSKPSGYSEQYSGAELIRRTVATAGVPHTFLTNVQNFQSEAALWVTMVLMSGFFEGHPKINAAVFEASSTWLSFLIDECDKAYRLYRNERQLP